MSEIIESFSREEEIKLFATPIELDLGYEVFVEINLLDKDKNILKTITPKGVIVEKNPNKNKYGDSEEIIIYKFVINELAKDINPKNVKFVTGWIDANDDKEINILYNELSILKVSECYCYRDFTVDEVKSIVKELRDSENATKGNYELFASKNCKLPQSERTYERFTEELNKTFRKYEINTCLRKIHFLAQAYVESAGFNATEEFGTENYLKGKKYYPYYGRGLMQLTWDFNAAKYYDYNHNTKYFQRYIKYLDENNLKPNNFRLKDCINKKLKNGTECLNQNNYNDIENMFINISYKLKYTIDVSGWFWRRGSAWGDLNKSADKDDSLKISLGVNGGTNAYIERKKFTKVLIQKFNLVACQNVELDDNKILGKYTYVSSYAKEKKLARDNKNELEKYDDK